MENKNYIKSIERRIREIAKDYENKGYLVIINPSQSNLPGFLKGYNPDIIAQKENDNVLIEVKTIVDYEDLKRFESVISKISNKSNWRFEIVSIDVKVKALSQRLNPLSEQVINERIEEINKLIRISSYEAAFLLSWSTIEAILRKKINEEKNRTVENSTFSIIKTMFSLGLLNQNEYKSLQEFNHVRNSLIHGFEQPIDKNIILDILKLIDNLTGKSRELELLNWLNLVDLEDYEEIYSLYRTVLGNENYGLFNITEKGSKIILQADHLDEILEFDNESDLKKFADLIEEEYMDDMGVEGWYAFQRAMEKDD